MFSVRSLHFLAVALLPLASLGCSRSAPSHPTTTRHEAPPRTGAHVTTVGYSVPALTGDYRMNTVCDTDAHLTIRGVTVNDTKTIVDLRFNNVNIGDETARGRIKVAAPGQENAFYIADPERRAEYALLNVEGIALEPKWTLLHENDVIDFRLTFERIPDSLTTFHLIEGKVPTMDTAEERATSWTFMNVRLK
jgi:hypothetical protein